FSLFFFLLMALAAHAQQIDPVTYGGMKWRLIGPFRGGRVLAVTGVPSQPNTYYFGATGGGVWKTTDGGITWDSLFDKQPVSSTGAIAARPGKEFYIYTISPARWMWFSIRRTRTFFLPRCGKAGERRGRSMAAAQKMDCIGQMTMGRLGSAWKATDCLKGRWAASACRFPAAIRTWSTRSSKRRKAGCIAATMVARNGRSSMTTTASASARGISRTFGRTRRMRTRCI